MTDVHEPVRWLDDPDAGAALRSDLAHGASATASGIDYGASLTALRGAIAAQTAPLPVAASSGSGLSVGIKVVLGVLLVGGIAVWASRGDVDDGDAKASTIVRAEPTPPIADEVAPVPAPIERAASKPALSPIVPEEPALAPVSQPAVADDDDAKNDRVAKARKRSDDAPRTSPGTDTPATPEATTDADRYVREAKLVAQARRALAAEPSRALALTQQAEREFPNGLLEEERRALAIRALAALGRADEAKSAAKGFLAKFSDGPHAAAVRRAID